MAEKWQVTTMNYSHEALVDQLIANPAATNADLGRIFGRSAIWVGLVKSSGMFREAYARRFSQVADPLLVATLEERLDMLTARSLEILNEKLARPSADVSDELALEAAKLGAKGLSIGGFGTRPPAAQAPPAPNRIESLKERLLALNRQPAEVIDVNFKDVPQAAEARQAASAGG